MLTRQGTRACDLFPCLACDRSFKSESDRDQHRMSDHSALYVVGKCLLCKSPQLIPNVFAFRDHFRQMHSTTFGLLIAHAALKASGLNEIEILSSGFIRNEEDGVNLMMTAITVKSARNSSQDNSEEGNEAMEASANDEHHETGDVKPTIDDMESDEFAFACFSDDESGDDNNAETEEMHVDVAEDRFRSRVTQKSSRGAASVKLDSNFRYSQLSDDENEDEIVRVPKRDERFGQKRAEDLPKNRRRREKGDKLRAAATQIGQPPKPIGVHRSWEADEETDLLRLVKRLLRRMEAQNTYWGLLRFTSELNRAYRSKGIAFIRHSRIVKSKLRDNLQTRPEWADVRRRWAALTDAPPKELREPQTNKSQTGGERGEEE